MSIQELYLQKRISAADAVRQVRNGDFIIVPTGVGEPPTLLAALSEQRRDFHDVKVAQILAMRKYAYIDPATADHVRHVAFFYGGATRAGGQAGLDRFHSELLLGDPEQYRTRADSRRRRIQHGVADGRPRLFLHQSGRRLHHGRHRQGPRGGARGQPQRTLCLRKLSCARLEGHSAGRKQRAGARSRAAEDRPGAGGHRQICRRLDRRRFDAADRLRRHPRRRGHATHAQARPRHPHRDDRRRHPDAGGERRRHKPAQELPARKDDCDLRSRLQQALPLHGSQPGPGNPSGGLHQRSHRWRD